MSRMLALALFTGALMLGVELGASSFALRRTKFEVRSSPVYADLAAALLGKKEEPKSKKDDKQAGDKKIVPKDLPALPAREKPEEIIKRIKENMEKSANLLKDEDPGDKTRKLQRDVVRDLDELINQEQNNQNQSGGGGGGGGSASSGGGGRSGRRGQRMAGGNSQGGGGQKSGQKGGQGNDPANQGGGGGKQDLAKKNTPSEIERNLWGHLPAHKRLEMDAYSRERFMPRYEDLLRQYYRTIAEQSRRKDE